MSSLSVGPVILLSIPGLRRKDLETMPRLNRMADEGQLLPLNHSLPCMTWPSQSNMLTGKLPTQHGIIANGIFWRKQSKVEMWTAWNEVIQQPQIWDVLKEVNADLKTMAWFPMLSKGCNADIVCMPAPIHKPDGREDMWCYTKPQEYYGALLDELGHFPLHHFWGPIANIASSRWIVESAIRAIAQFQPDFVYMYVPHLDYAAQKFGPDSEQAIAATTELDSLLGELFDTIKKVDDRKFHWLAVSEYVIESVDHVTYPNRELRDAGLLELDIIDGREHLNYSLSKAWCMVDHQIGQVFVKDRDKKVIEDVVSRFSQVKGIEHVLHGSQLREFGLEHERTGDVVLLSSRNSWQAYYWWNDDAKAPEFATTVDIHRKPGYDPVELFIDMPSKKTPLDATLVKGSHGLSHADSSGVLISSKICTQRDHLRDTDVFDVLVSSFAR
jgi:hypothetical protein